MDEDTRARLKKSLFWFKLNVVALLVVGTVGALALRDDSTGPGWTYSIAILVCMLAWIGKMFDILIGKK